MYKDPILNSTRNIMLLTVGAEWDLFVYWEINTCQVYKQPDYQESPSQFCSTENISYLVL